MRIIYIGQKTMLMERTALLVVFFMGQSSVLLGQEVYAANNNYYAQPLQPYQNNYGQEYPNELKENYEEDFFIYKDEFWLIVQQGLVISLLVMAIIYSAYVLLIPLAVGRSLNRMTFNLDGIMENALHGLTGRIMKSLDPVDLTFGVLNIEDEACRKRAKCELKATNEQSKNKQYVKKKAKSCKDRHPGCRKDLAMSLLQILNKALGWRN